MEMINNSLHQIEHFIGGTEHHQRFDVEKFIYDYLIVKVKEQKYFAFDIMNKKCKLPVTLLVPVISLSDQYESRCHRRLDLYV